MFRQLGSFVSHWWFVVAGCWVAVFIGLRLASPPFEDIAKGGEFVFLPLNTDSRQGEALLNRAFPGRQTASNIVLIVRRDDPNGLTDDDRTFIDDKLRPAIEQIRDATNAAPKVDLRHVGSAVPELITEIHTYADHGIGEALTSADQKSSLVTIDLATDFQDTRNWEPVQKVSDLIARFEASSDIPKGLQLALTGSATLGRDMSAAEINSARNIGTLTIVMVVVLLVVIYRAPLLALVPLLTLFLAVDISLHLLTLLATTGYVHIFKGLQVYTTVITYGPGIDYCLFLIARYKENLQAGDAERDALPNAIGQVGSAIVASGATVICGIGMLTFAQFGKFHEAGIGISIALVITLLATLTLTPALLCMAGRWAFWPMAGEQVERRAADASGPAQPVVQRNLFQPLWVYMGDVIERHPLRILLITGACLVPFAVVGVATYDTVNYGLIESLPKSTPSALGAQVLEQDFPAGITGPVTVLLQNSAVDFRDDDGIEAVGKLVENLMKRRDELKIANIRSISNPLGTSVHSSDKPAEESSFQKAVEQKATRRRSVDHYVSEAEAVDGHVTEMELILSTNPFSMDSVQVLNQLTSAIPEALPAELKDKTTVAFVGPTASVRDVNLISHSDQQRIYVLVVVSVLVILVVLLRAFTLSVYLIATVLLSFLATLGLTWLVFYGLDPRGFTGLDWTVPLFLFVVLIAVGEDYNIFLVTRIHEEQQREGPRKGILVALTKTGGIITSCGFIMAGTFASLTAGSLVRMQQLGFALAFGVMLDTFVIRPILVPAFLMVLNDPRYGNLARYAR